VYAIPTVLDCERKSLDQLREEISTLARRAVAGELTAAVLAGATFTLSNAGELGVGSATPVIVAPQAAALAAGAIREVAVVRDRALTPGHAMTITLACDHRILYGWHAARFLQAIKTRLEQASL
jgi:pyruvate/2-oxoglutarate dehydrogenase complex dihydrolipoamide acyltransferase (E2) component